jgi:hypothetical protein
MSKTQDPEVTKLKAQIRRLVRAVTCAHGEKMHTHVHIYVQSSNPAGTFTALARAWTHTPSYQPPCRSGLFQSSAKRTDVGALRSLLAHCRTIARQQQAKLERALEA